VVQEQHENYQYAIMNDVSHFDRLALKGFTLVPDMKNVLKSSLPDPDTYGYGPPGFGSVIYFYGSAPDPDPSINKQNFSGIGLATRGLITVSELFTCLVCMYGNV